MKTFNIREETILKKLEKIFNVDNVRYNILTGNFVYYINNENIPENKRHKHLKSVTKQLEHKVLTCETPQETKELAILLRKLNDSYFDVRFKKYFKDFYEQNNLTLPRNIYITSGFIEFYNLNNEKFYLAYEDDLDEVFKKALKIINKN